jgi:hypothetical protein
MSSSHFRQVAACGIDASSHAMICSEMAEAEETVDGSFITLGG